MPRLKQPRNDLAELIFGAAAVQRVSSVKMAEVLGVSRPTIYKIRKDPIRYMPDVLYLARYLQIPIEELRGKIKYPY